MRLLLTNDDGIDAPGLEALERIARALSDDVWICAPAVEQSGKGRGITLTEPLRVNRLGDRRFAVTGTPTDCVVLAVNDLMPEKPDLVLSGVNRGHNVGEDVSYSGTVAGALQGMAFGIRSIALSQSLERFHDEVVAHFETAEAYAPAIIHRLLEQTWADGVVMNLNFPARPPEAVTEVEVTRQGFRDLGEMHAVRRTDLRGRDYYWMSFRGAKQEHPDGTDLRAMDEGRISVTPLHIDLTHMPSIRDLKGVLGGAPPRAVA
ncbi:MAG: 5'/3'-nucleotidase SurE [Brevundimonas sp.]|jgi:5'-nucleotidase|uniref:5'/3'-nucleotidase SurE n=1 Tax=Brevundimonas sp. TaxID=1871086 RepID=UPI0022BCC469|nr:5'/3'-nucleotidase SurE [Brevundimonas sp.]MCZ8087512.1 5'/3'-nucleotidase SurE [Brevundimonas sp.]MCZ8194376.1 5'/3'-nucleotidase SurE [Brevundimonas sp.]